MELFKEFKDNKENYKIIQEYLKNNLNESLINKLKENAKKPLQKIYGHNEKLGDYVLKAFNPFSINDYKLFKSIIQDKDLMKTTTIFKGNIASDKQAMENFLNKSISQPLFNAGMYHIFKQKEFAGMVGGNLIIKENKPVEFALAIYLKRLFQCSGLAYETGKMTIQNILKKYPNIKIWSTTMIDFKPAIRLNKKLGMICKGQVYKYNKDFLVDYHEYKKP